MAFGAHVPRPSDRGLRRPWKFASQAARAAITGGSLQCHPNTYEQVGGCFPQATNIIGGMSRRSALIAALLVAIAGCTIAVVLKGEGDYLLGVLVAVGVWSLLGLALMMRWTISLQFWGAVGNWLR